MLQKSLALTGGFLALACVLANPPSGTAATEPPPVEAFIAPEEFRSPKLSPDGKLLGLTGTREFADYFALIDVSTMQVIPGATFTDVRLVNYWWKGNDWVLLLIESFNGSRTFRAFDLKTKKIQPLHEFNRIGGAIVNPLVGDSDHVLVSTYTSTGTDLRKLNVRTGKSVVIERNPGFVRSWLTDRAGNAVGGFGLLDGEWFLLTRPKRGAEWRRQSLGRKLRPDFWPTAVHHDQRRLLGWEQLATDTVRIVARDPVTNEDEVLFHDPAVDPSYNVTWSDDDTNVRGVAFETDHPRIRYFDSGDAQLARQIDASLPDASNAIVSASADESRLIIESSSSHKPPHYYLLDRAVPRIVPLGVSNATSTNFKYVPSEFYEFTARDGLKLSGRIHRPADAGGPTPLIVLTGWDFARRSYEGFKPAIQLFVSRGYAVLSVNHRGVEGFGERFAALGNETIDTAMADDLADAARSAIAQGWTEPGRIALFGESKGGILALYALERNPDVFSVWLNYNTPMKRSAFWLDDLSFGKDRVAARFRPVKEEIRLRDYRAKLDPLGTARQIRVPSFHFYPGGSLIGRDGLSLKKHLSAAGLPHRFVTGLATQKWANDLEDSAKQAHEENVRYYRELLAFLAERLPPAP